MLEHRQHERRFGIEQDAAKVVKLNERERLRSFFAQAVFPVVAIAADARGAGLVCLSAKFAVLDSHAFSVRGTARSPKRMDRLLGDLKGVIGTRVPATLVLERSHRTSLDPSALAVVEEAGALGREIGMRVHRLSVVESSGRIVIDAAPTLKNATRSLLPRYESLRTRLVPGGTMRVNDYDVWRRHRSLAVAFCLAHAFALEAVTAAARPFGPQPPPSFPPYE